MTTHTWGTDYAVILDNITIPKSKFDKFIDLVPIDQWATFHDTP